MAQNPLRLATSLDNDVDDRMESLAVQEDWYQAIDTRRPIKKKTIYLDSIEVPDHIQADYQQGVLKVTVPNLDNLNP
jgi:hypothetical protein